MILLLHLIISTIMFIIYMTFINKQAEYVEGIQSLFNNLNYTISSADILLTILIFQKPIYVRSSDKFSEIKYMNDILGTNALFMYDINKKINSLTLFVDDQDALTDNNKVLLKYIETNNTIADIELNYYDAVSEVIIPNFINSIKFS